MVRPRAAFETGRDDADGVGIETAVAAAEIGVDLVHPLDEEGGVFKRDIAGVLEAFGGEGLEDLGK